jgi:hypothetical protein
MEEISREEKEGFVVKLFKLYAEYAESQPTLQGNKTLPSYAFYNAKDDAANYDRIFEKEMKKQGKLDEQEEADDVNDAYNPQPVVRHYDEDSDDEDRYRFYEANKLKIDHPELCPVDPTTGKVPDEYPEDFYVRVELKTKGKKVKNIEAGELVSKDEVDIKNLGYSNDDELNPNEEEKSDWNMPKKESDIIIVAIIENQNTKSFNLKMQFICDDDTARENICAPVNEVFKVAV